MINRGPSSPLPLAHTSINESSGSSFHLTGKDGWLSPALESLSPQPSNSNHSHSSSFYPVSNQKSENISRLTKIVYVAALVSWLTMGKQALFGGGNSHLAIIDELQVEAAIVQAQMTHLQDDVDRIDSYVFQERKLLSRLKKTRTALDHEVRMVTEVEESSGSRMKAQPRNANLIKGWLNHRKDGLHTKITKLQRYLQANSRVAVINTYGPGPTYRVKFTVDMKADSGKRIVREFVVETAPINLMPNSIHLFMDMIAGGIWDNTVFLHHEDVEHVIAAAPVDYATQKVKHRQINSLGWVGLGFPEYREEYPHKQYTLGFAGQGPTFYINTLDNSDAHGPGGQGHHLLSTDADPCFAKVVEGVDLIDDLIRLGMSQKKVGKEGDHPWADDEHTWTHIVSAKILSKETSTDALVEVYS